jgi:hypothetical protein
MEEVIAFEKLISAFQKVPTFKAPPPTFMEIAGSPHYENVCSNILAFYFDPTQPHGFGDLMVKSLLESIGKLDMLNEIGNILTVQREDITYNQKRIDLVMTTSNCVIAIENKIYANLYNDLDDYSSYVNQCYKKSIQIKVVLSLNSIQYAIQAGFIGVTYASLFSSVKKNIGNYLITADTKYVTHLIDFIQTIQNLKKMVQISPEVLDFFAKNIERVEELLEANKQINNLILEKVYQLRDNLEPPPAHVKQWIWEKRDLVHDFNLGDAEVAVDTVIGIDGITICIWVRRGAVDKHEYLKRLNYFRKYPINDTDWRDDRIDVVKKGQMPFNISIEKLLEKVSGILKDIYIP